MLQEELAMTHIAFLFCSIYFHFLSTLQILDIWVVGTFCLLVSIALFFWQLLTTAVLYRLRNLQR